MHNGVDLPADTGTEIYASRAGIVTIAQFQESAGNYVTIAHTSPDDKNTKDGYMSTYMHMNSYVVSVGDYVEAGQHIGYVGNTGASINPHLHFGIFVSTDKSALVSLLPAEQQYKYNGSIYVNPDLYAKFSGGYEEGELANIPATSDPTVWLNKQPPSYTNWKPLFHSDDTEVKGNIQSSNLLNRRRNLIANSSKVLFENGKVNQDIGLGYSYVGINAYHPEASVDTPYVHATSSQKNIIARANYMFNSTWICQDTRNGWRGKYTFNKGDTYHIPYGQPVRQGKYIGFQVTVDDFLEAAADANSEFYKYVSNYENGKTSTYYASDCSAFVSWCWGLKTRATTGTISGVSTYISKVSTDDGVSTDNIVKNLQLGDCLNSTTDGHVVLVTGLTYDSNGILTEIEITEQTPPQLKRTSYTPKKLLNKYGSKGYSIYRYTDTVPDAPTSSSHATTTSSTITSSTVTREYINNYISKTSSGAYKTGELNKESQDKVAKYILSYLCNYPDKSKRWTPNAVIGMLGNMVAESGLNPARWEGDTNRYLSGERGIKKGFGLVQWTPWNKHWDWCGERGYDPYDIDGQLEHIQWEFFDSEADQYTILRNDKYVNGYYNQFSKDPFYTGAVKSYIDGNYNLSKKVLVPVKREEFPISSLSVEILTIGFATNYERPGIEDLHAERRVSNSKRFAGLLGNNHYEPRAVLPTADIGAVTDYWTPLGVTVDNVKGVNPYLSNTSKHISDCKGYINNAYAWGRAIEILLSTKERKDISNTLCSDRLSCWFDYNKDKQSYEYDKMPRVGSIICWEKTSFNESLQTERSYLGIVEEVIGSDVIKISKMSTDSKSTNKFDCITITNENSNWGKDTSNYTFKGFIHILPQTLFYPNVSLHENGTMHIKCNSTTGESYTSVLFGVQDMKHFNKMKIVYDLKITPPKNGNYKVTGESEVTGEEDTETQIVPTTFYFSGTSSDGAVVHNATVWSRTKEVKENGEVKEVDEVVAAVRHELSSVDLSGYSEYKCVGVIGDSLSVGTEDYTVAKDPDTVEDAETLDTDTEEEDADKNDTFITSEDSWPYQLSQLARNQSKLLGFSGATSATFIKRGYLDAALKEGNRCNAYIIGLGFNDCFGYVTLGEMGDITGKDETLGKDGKYQDWGSYYFNMEKILRKIHTFNPDAPIFVLTNPYFYNKPGTYPEEYNEALRKILSKYGEKYKAYLIDLYNVYGPIFKELESVRGPSNHFDKHTYLYMGQIIGTAITRCMKKDSKSTTEQPKDNALSLTIEKQSKDDILYKVYRDSDRDIDINAIREAYDENKAIVWHVNGTDVPLTGTNIDTLSEMNDTSIVLDKLDDYCNFYVYMSQQVVSCGLGSDSINKHWPNTYFPKYPSEEDDSNVDEGNMGYPCPDGMILLSSSSSNDLTINSRYSVSNGSFVFTNMSKVVQLNTCTYNGKQGVSVFDEGDGVKKFNRELQTYIGLSVMSLPAVFVDVRYETSVDVIVKKIILYG